ncbi:carboxypeptidase D isoform X2 [Glossina fuscipes]|uniref:Carboxypeptidase D isoform X2 n=1 Tax=Glossina fuscipes TaxID=7396 RepID=A0A9C5ZIE7_9MUSC|nr:carboxypeptidase D isoform X2 [Glossina fuscipes]XP_037900269.1 carboxypeptidase D isoform X2 [Glossina fuscipes]
MAFTPIACIMRPSFLPLLYIYIVLNVTLTSRCQAATVPHFHDKEDESFVANPFYHSNPDLEDMFSRFLKNYPEHAQVYTIGHSTEGRPLLVLKICQHSRYTNLLTPSVKLVANMHGDEVVGRQMLIYFAQYLLMNYQTNLEISELINSTDIYIMPSMNPDGFQVAQEGNCESLPDYVGRNNAAGEDLNRDFPDRLDNEHHAQLRTEKRQPETAAVIDFTLSKPFILSANFHGGAVVAGYPYDNSIAHHECCEESVAPDDVVFKHLAHAYADNHPSMRLGNSCNETFPGGITNGAKWYELDGGMQDFNYVFANCFELTIELTCCKYPLAQTLPDEWANNKRSLINFLKQAHIGIKGLVKDVNGYPIHDARIVVSGFEGKTVRTTQRGEYWRLLVPGTYDVLAMAFGFQNSEVQKVEVTNDNAAAQRLDFTLSPISNNIDGNFHKIIVERADKAEDVEKNGGFLTLTEFVHHNYAAMEKFLHDIADNYPSITRLYSIGKSVQNRDLLVMELFAKPGEHLPNVPEFKYVANMHGNEVVGKEMLLLLTKYICERYMYDDRITKLVNNTRMHFLYSMNPDGYEIAREDDNTNAIGRENANNVDLNRNFPDQYGTDRNNRVTEPEVKAVMNWTLSIPFVLSANLHGGSLVANYPFDDNANDFNDPFARLRDAKVSRKLNPTDDHELFKHLAKVYSKAHPTMHFGSPCPKFKQEIFPDGIVNGAQWYSVTGGMQDWNYVRAGVMEITLELGCVKYPKASELLKYWKDNRESLLLFIEQVHNGIHGFVRSSIGNPVPQAAITVDGSRHTVYSDTYGDYWRLALPGRHNLTVLADGFSPEREAIEISAEKRSLRLDITLMRDDDQHWASANDYRIIENVVHTRYHTNPQIRERLAEFETHNDNGQIATFGYAENEFGLYYNSIKLTSDIGAPEENKFKILILSSFFDTTSPLGREISLNLVRHIIEGYKLKEPRILKFLQNAVLYVVPAIENFETVFKLYNGNKSICDPVIRDELGERLLSPESEKRRDLLLQFLDNERFDLMLTFIAGHSELIYPKDEQIFERFAHYIENVEFSFSPLQCSASSTRTVHRDTTERLTNLLYKTYNIPMFSLGLSCCRMPPQTQIASIWRKNIDKLKHFLHLIETGAKGYVQDEKGSPLREAFIRLIDHKPVYNVTKNLARFQLMLPVGLYALEISAPKYQSYVAKVEVIQGKITDLGVIKLSAYTLITGHSEIVPLGRIRHQATVLSGFVLDLSNHPVPHAKVSIIAPITKHYLRNFTDSIGAYTINNIPNGDITLKVEAPRYLEATRLVHVTDDGMPIKGVVFRLKRNEHVMGMPRFIFIVFASIAIIIVVVMCILCAQFFLARRHRTDKPYYNFSLLPQKGKELFEDDDLGDDGETELFRSPIKKGMIIKPYFDDDDDDLKHIMHSDNDGDDSDDYSDVADKHAIMDSQIKAKHVYNDDSGEEVIMLHKQQNH